MNCEQKDCKNKDIVLYFCSGCRGLFCYSHKPLDNGGDWHRCTGNASAEGSQILAAAYIACRELNSADPKAAANAMPEVVAALEAILSSSETALPVELTEKAEDALNALKGETDG